MEKACQILRELADGGSLMVSELAQRTGSDPSVISRQIAPLRQAGILITPRNRLYEIAPQYLADPKPTADRLRLVPVAVERQPICQQLV